MKLLLLSTLLFFSLITTLSWAKEKSTGFPTDFPMLKDSGGLGKGTVLTGFGGNSKWDSATHKKKIKKTPIILLHGNGTNASDKKWGMISLRSRFLDAGYTTAEIWGVSYLGSENDKPDMPYPHSRNIDDVRRFIDAVIKYTGAKKVDIIGHSLGGNLARCYMLGLSNEGRIEPSMVRFDKIRTLVTLASAHHGLGTLAPGEFKTGSKFETQLRKIGEIEDESPYGPSKLSRQQGKHLHISKIDNDSIAYLGLTAKGDFIDIQNPGTGRFRGANINRSYSLGPGLTGHKRIIHDKDVFADILAFLTTKRRLR